MSRWWRRAVDGRPASAWPSGGPFGTVALRLPRAKDELEMMVHASAGLLVPDGRLLVYGAKDEGAGSAARRIGRVFGTVRSVATGGRCRLLLAGDPAPLTGLRPTLEAWEEAFASELDELPGRWVSFPGVFAHGRLDGGTRLLLEHLPDVASGDRVLDFGCGHGIVGAVVRARRPSAEVDFLDVDALALEAVRRNVPGARTVLSDGWSRAPAGPWDAVLSNPPYHRGKGESTRVVRELVEGSVGRIAPAGRLAMVVQRRLGVEPWLARSFGEVEVLGDRGPWRVWGAGRPRPG